MKFQLTGQDRARPMQPTDVNSCGIWCRNCGHKFDEPRDEEEKDSEVEEFVSKSVQKRLECQRGNR